ncbi:unnamed protein product, partial [Amoebophrya sp. A25]|eukprot:GSA25T00003958001.1
MLLGLENEARPHDLVNDVARQAGQGQARGESTAETSIDSRSPSSALDCRSGFI